ncbi:MAG: protease complex subunit PrcB family protein [Elusimicrobia bacterium]|nr:protease complex subunit PrcB family protein [Elusimicrobiota bacterium]
MNRLVLIAAALLAVLPARAQQWQRDSLKGQASAICEKKTVVVKNDKEWGDLWKQHAGEEAKAPKVDFTREMVVAVFLGQRPKAGYQVDIVLMPDPLDKNKLVVFYSEVFPKGGYSAQVVSRPYAMVKVKIHASVAFEVNQSAGVLPGEERQKAPRRITPDQTLRMYDAVGKLKGFDGSYDGLYRP